ncbi:divalent metal cation transporter [Chryseotalea sanaruensis]|uniref:Divalent metal cation transporter n=1 Tax=Chryseotalea sanaruensis TaxID=2482724 RepID=A0A401UCN3_9BACT|nr:NRAMP family divalent metal transporter [Chryseotalea sanaruensis]GCC52658.1 divalent metal cation transporter [Chryseotalea sanaruensis]
MTKLKTSSAILGAAFLMATSAIGPGFLTQTTVFTEKLLASFGFVILISILLDVVVQLNIWRVLTMTKMRAQDLANEVVPGLGYVLAGLIVFGGLVFNVANMGGCGLGFNVISSIPVTYGALLSGVVALFIFWLKEFGKALDVFTKTLGVLMILLTLYIAISSNPPMGEAFKHSVLPERIDLLAIVTLVGGTVGGYISFAGAHRLLDAGISGAENIKEVTRSAVSGIVITGVMRIILFLAVLGVVAGGIALAKENPAAAVFQEAAGNVGYKFFGVVMWSAAITSVVGCAYTSISFLRSLHPFIERNQRYFTSGFILISTIIFMLIGQPVSLLIIAGAVNGFILPIALTIVLVAASKRRLAQSNYQHAVWMRMLGWVVVLVMTTMSGISIYKLLVI